VTEEYCFTIGAEGQKSLALLDITFNDQSQYFLKKHGLQQGMSVLDIGCGLGSMTQLMAEMVGNTGKVVAIDNNDNQVNAAQNRCSAHLQKRITWQVGDIYNLEKLGEKFDLVYCRFVLHHIHKPRLALSQVEKVLKPQGTYIGIEGIVNSIFSIPDNAAWRSEDFPIEVAEGTGRNANIGKILPLLILEANMKCIESAIYQPMLILPEVRRLLLVGECFENKDHQIENGFITEAEWQRKHDNLKNYVEDENNLIGFCAANFTASRKV
jgi:SAM-dependent methyltransferase